MEKKSIIILFILILIMLVASFFIWRNISGNVVSDINKNNNCDVANLTSCRAPSINFSAAVEFELDGKPLMVV